MINKAPKPSSKSNISSEAPSKSETEYKFEILPQDYTNIDLSFKIIVIGDIHVGKSCLANKAVKNIFSDSYIITVGFEFFSFNVKINDKVVKLEIWDTCGQEIYISLISNYYRKASLAIMVYAINSKKSFDNLEMWLRELRTYSNPDVKIFLIGNKIDLENEREVTKEEGEKFCKDNNILEFMESSAKTGVNAQNIFIKAAQKLYEDYIAYQKNVKLSENRKVQFKIKNNYQKKSDDRTKNDNKPKKKKIRCC